MIVIDPGTSEKTDPALPEGEARQPDRAVNATSIGGNENKGQRGVVGTALALSSVPCVLTGIDITNTSGAIAYVQFFDRPATDVLVGTTVPFLEYAVAASGGQFTKSFGNGGTKAKFGLSVASTTTSGGSTGSGASVHVYVQLDAKTGAIG